MYEYKSIVFIEGIEHKRFLTTYIEILERIGEPYLVVSFEDLNLNHEKFKQLSFKTISRKDLINFALNVKAKIFITTTPGIGNVYFPSSKAMPSESRPKYIYVFHSLVSPNNIYLKNSFKNYDLIFSPNHIITEQLKFLTKKSSIHTTGYPLFSSQVKKTNKLANTILIAPSWGKKNLLSDPNLLNVYINYFISKKLKIVLRPHPMELEKIKDVTYIDGKSVNIDTNKELIDLHEYQYLMTDWSGIALEFFYYTKQPVLFSDSPKKIRRNLSYKEKNILLIEDLARKNFGFVLNINNKNLFDEINNFKMRSVSNKLFNDIFTPIFEMNKVQKIFESLL